MEVTFKIAKITASNEGKTAVLTLTVGIALFGIADAKRNVYYVGGITADSAKTLAIGQELKDNLANYWLVKRPYFVKEKATWVLCTWLHSKIQHPDGVQQEPYPAEYLEWLKLKHPAVAAA